MSARSLAAPLLFVMLAHAAAARFDAWKFDVLHLKNGRRVQGLLVEETPQAIRFRYVIQRPGERTSAFPATVFTRAEIERVEPLLPEDRQLLRHRLHAIDERVKNDKEREKSLELRPVPWGNDGPARGLEYASEQFTLRSNAGEDTVRRVAVRLEQIYAAYARVLPPRTFEARPTAILVVQSMAEYRTLLKAQGRNFSNPALYDTARNEIVCASDLKQLDDQLKEVRLSHEQLLARLRKDEAELNRLYKNKVPAKFLQPIKDTRQQIERTNQENEKRFRDATRQFFQVLYHEAFHAYLANYVYPPAEGEVPRWLNEGLAQIFEKAVFEAGEARVGHADPDRLKAVKSAVRKQELIRLPELLTSSGRDFLVAHATDREVSDRHYLASWALAFYLTFERRKLGTPEFDRYTRACKGGANPLEAFQSLVNQPLPQFERAWHAYLLELRHDGTKE